MNKVKSAFDARWPWVTAIMVTWIMTGLIWRATLDKALPDSSDKMLIVFRVVGAIWICSICEMDVVMLFYAAKAWMWETEKSLIRNNIIAPWWIGWIFGWLVVAASAIAGIKALFYHFDLMAVIETIRSCAIPWTDTAIVAITVVGITIGRSMTELHTDIRRAYIYKSRSWLM